MSNKKICEICGASIFKSSIYDHVLKYHNLTKRDYLTNYVKSIFISEIDGECFQDLCHLSIYLKKKGVNLEEYWHKYFKPEHPEMTGFCKQCNKKLKFNGLGQGYSIFCGFSCSTKWYAENTDRIEKAMNTLRQEKENNPNYQLQPVQIKYWINKGYSEVEAKKLVSERQKTFTLEKCIKKYGEEEGIKKWKSRQDKWQNTLKSKPLEEQIRINKAKFNNGVGFSKISQKIFWEIYNYNIATMVNLDVYFAELNKDENDIMDSSGTSHEYCLVDEYNKFYFLDFYIKKLNLLIEFDGDYWHNVRGNKERDAIREKNILTVLPGLKIIRISEKEYKEKSSIILESIKNDINARIEEYGLDIKY
jgi:hypothetical protein